MKLFRFLFFFVVGILVTPSFAQFVKVKSYECHSRDKQKVGSGSLWFLQGDFYVLTSDHVIFHGGLETGFCHSGLLDIGKVAGGTTVELSLEFVAANWSRGLALLKVTHDLSKNEFLPKFFTLDSLTDTERGQNLEISAFPFHSVESVLTPAKVLLSKSSRHLLPKLSTVSEVLGHNEYGMSGGTLWDSKANQFYGLLSHQYLFQKIGAPPEIGDESDLVVGSDPIGLCIQSSQVKSWIETVFEKSSYAQLLWNPKEQSTGLQSVIFEGVKFSRVDCVPLDSSNNSILPVGGSGDGVGIGGSKPMQRSQSICSVEVSSSQQQGFPWPFKFRSSFEKLKVSVSRPPAKVKLSHFFESSGKELYAINDKLETFFTQWELGLKALGKRESEHQDSKKLLENLDRLKQKILLLTTQLSLEKSRESAVLEFAKSLESLNKRLAISDGYTVVFDDELKDTYENPIWSHLFLNYDLITLSQLRSSIAELRELLNLLRS